MLLNYFNIHATTTKSKMVAFTPIFHGKIVGSNQLVQLGSVESMTWQKWAALKKTQVLWQAVFLVTLPLTISGSTAKTLFHASTILPAMQAISDQNLWFSRPLKLVKHSNLWPELTRNTCSLHLFLRRTIHLPKIPNAKPEGKIFPISDQNGQNLYTFSD